jgi:ADP-heptose:LPS heptosyltransferase
VPKTPGRYLVCVNVNTSVLGVEGRLPLGHFRGLLARLAAETPVHLVFIGSKGEAPYVERAVAMFEGIAPLTNVAGRTTVAELLSLIKHADLLVTNDTGPLHLAVGLRTPSLSFFGPANPANFGPREGPHTIAYGDAMCSPCINEANMKKPPCRGRNVCIAAMDPEDLGRLAVETMLSPPPAPRIVSPRLLEPDEVKRVLLNNAEEGRE